MVMRIAKTLNLYCCIAVLVCISACSTETSSMPIVQTVVSKENNPPSSDISGIGNTTMERKIIGTIIENVRDYDIDGPGVLRIRTDLDAGQPIQDIEVTYFYGENPPCPNQTAFNQAYVLEPGTRVEIFGAVVSAMSLSVCDSSAYYVKSLTP